MVVFFYVSGGSVVVVGREVFFVIVKLCPFGIFFDSVAPLQR